MIIKGFDRQTPTKNILFRFSIRVSRVKEHGLLIAEAWFQIPWWAGRAVLGWDKKYDSKGMPK